MSQDSRTDDDDGRLVDLETRLLLDKIGIVVGLLMFVVGLTGEILGWWDALGIIITLAGLVVSLFSAMDQNGAALIEGQSTARSVRMRMVSNQMGMLGNQDAMIQNQGRMIENQGRMIANQEQVVENQDQMLDKQEQVVDNQEDMVGLLERIADTLERRLPGGG